jgi:hypothetical protein
MAPKRCASDMPTLSGIGTQGRAHLNAKTLIGSKCLRENDFNKRGMKFVQIQSLSRRSMG